jgi:hypothetical protein
MNPSVQRMERKTAEKTLKIGRARKKMFRSAIDKTAKVDTSTSKYTEMIKKCLY